MPKIAKIEKMNIMKKKTRIRPGIEPKSAWICYLMAGNLLMDLSGLKIRNVRSDFKLSEPPLIGKNPTTLMNTMKKSRQFQGSRR